MTKDAFPKFITPEFRAVYVWVDRPQPPMEGSVAEPRYKCGMLFDKKNKDVIAGLKTIKAAADGLLKVRFPTVTNAKLFQPWLRDGDTDPTLSENEMFKGMYYAQAKSKDSPGIVDAQRKPLMNAEDFYAGAYAIASIAMFTYDKAGNRGAGLLLNNIMKLRNGEKLSGKPSAESDFENVKLPAGAVDMDEDLPF